MFGSASASSVVLFSQTSVTFGEVNPVLLLHPLG